MDNIEKDMTDEITIRDDWSDDLERVPPKLTRHKNNFTYKIILTACIGIGAGVFIGASFILSN